MASRLVGLSRLYYILLALPLAVILYTTIGIQAKNAVMELLDITPANGRAFLILDILYYALVLPLMAVAALRLRALGWSPLLSLPMGLGVLIRYYAWWLFSDSAPEGWEMPLGSFEVMQLMRLYGLCLVLVLAVWPERRRRLPVSA